MASSTMWAISSENASSPSATARIAANSFCGSSAFRDQTARAQPHHLDVIVLAVRAGQHDRGHAVAGALQRAQHFKAVALRA